MALAVTQQETTSASPPTAPGGGQTDPIAVAVHLRSPIRTGVEARFAPSDPPRGWDVTRFPRVAQLVRNRRFQFFLILPNQIVFWGVIFIGFLGTAVPGLNFGTAITWYVWFCLVFVLMVVVGRAWCAMCPFGGFAEWVQRRSFWRRTQSSLGLGLKFPASLARMGFLIPVATFLLLTWIEEYANIAGPGNPAFTSMMVIGIVASALVFFLVFERRTFCRYICPLTTLVGTVGAMGSVAGFRTRDRDLCLACPTKDCMRGGTDGYGCPWYTWPGSADSNLSCGLCSECFKACPQDNIGLYLQKPLTSVLTPRRRRMDVAWAIATLWGLVLFQQFNATNVFTAVDAWLNATLHFPHYPNPVGYLGMIALATLATAAVVWVFARAFARRDIAVEDSGAFVDRRTRFTLYFAPLMYGLVPVVGADYFARQLPKFLTNSPRVLPAFGHLVGVGSVHSALYNASLVGSPVGIVAIQVAVVAVGTVVAAWATWRIAGRELVGISRNPMAIQVASFGLVLACGAGACVLYVLMHAAF
ncbi:MAG TPA: 4Fe-4S binding protein [Acidimicrobiales bacterium]|nr:4Fe-4S binding protein [Acidimicrobiales bacterium]